MHLYCKKCKKHSSNTFPKKLVLISKHKIKGKSKCAICLTERSFIDKIKYDLENALEIYPQFFIDWCYQMKTYCLKCKTNTENIDSKILMSKNNRLLMQWKCSVC